jgi:signal transduction histidine kinase
MLKRYTARLRLTVLYGLLMVLTGAGVLLIAGLVTVRSSTREAVPAVNHNQQPQSTASELTQARAEISHLQDQLAVQAHQANQALWHALVIGAVTALAIMAVVSVVLGWFTAHRVLRPLRRMTAATRRISADNLHERLAVPGPLDEVKDLADTIDGLLERLEGAFSAQRRFVANASHELRTPLSTMRASLDVAMAKPEPAPPQTAVLAGRLRTELDQVDRLLEGLLVLARVQHGDLPGATTLSLDAVLAAALAARADAIAAMGLTVRSQASPDGAWVHGSQALICRMVDNVLDNAILHNTVGGWIQAATATRGETAWLVVETGGLVLDQRQVAQLAQPFRRLGADRTGSAAGAGLGLSIVAAIAEAHGGTLDLHARAEGGLRVSIGLPLGGLPSGGLPLGGLARGGTA